jgi:hypothetical protein
MAMYWVWNSSINFPFKKFLYFLSLFVSIQVSDAYVKVLSIIVFYGINFSFLDMFLFLKKFCSIKYVFLALFIVSCKSAGIWWLLSSLSITPKYLKFPTLSSVQFFLLIVLFYFVLNFSFTVTTLKYARFGYYSL